MAIKGETCLCYKKSKLYNVVSVIDHYFHLLASVLINSTTGDVLCRENVVLTSFVHLRSVQYPAGLELQACIANSPGSSYSPNFRKKVREIPPKTTDLAYPSQIRTFRLKSSIFCCCHDFVNMEMQSFFKNFLCSHILFTIRSARFWRTCINHLNKLSIFG